MVKTERSGLNLFGQGILFCALYFAGCSHGVEEEPTNQPKPSENKTEVTAIVCNEPLQECDGVCADFQGDSENCGACGNLCSSGFECEKAVCVIIDPCESGACECISPEVDCGGRCVDLEEDSLNCGSCDNRCLDDASCEAGICTCNAADEEICGEACVNLNVSIDHCGSCDNNCVGEEQCLSGTCACANDDLSCDGICVDATTDPENCGGCGNLCDRSHECREGICVIDENPDECIGKPLHIQLTRVSLYQGVEVDLFRDGTAVAQASQAVDIIAQRQALIRLFTATDAAYESQTVSGRIYLKTGDLTEIFFTKKEVDSLSSAPEVLSSTINIQIPGEAIQPETEVWAELIACEEQPEGLANATRFPREPTLSVPLSARQTGLIRVAFLPYKHNGRAPDTSPEVIAEYVREIEKLYPTSGVEASVLEEKNSGQTGLINLETLLYRAQAQFVSDAPDKDIYYYGLVDPASSFASYCNGSCTTGIGYLNDSPQSNYQVAVGVGFGTLGAGTFAHELGHNHGREHAPCGGVADADPNYPTSYTIAADQIYASIGVRGYDIFEQELKEASLGPLNDGIVHIDHMAYCGPDWVSDYGYNIYADRISAVNEVTALGLRRGQSIAADINWRRIAVSPHEAQWLTPQTDSAHPSELQTSALVYDHQGTPITNIEIFRINLADSNNYLLLVPPPEQEWFAISLPNGLTLPY